MEKKRNQGSAIIEMTLLIPIFIGCIIMFIMLFLFLMDAGRKQYILCETLYSVDVTDGKADLPGTDLGSLKKEGTVLKIIYQEQGKGLQYHLSMRRNGNDPVKNIRRWQLAADLF